MPRLRFACLLVVVASPVIHCIPSLALETVPLRILMKRKVAKKSCKAGSRALIEQPPEDCEEGQQHFHCYLLRSLDPLHPHLSYIGYTKNPHRRLRQHNGLLKNGGALRTRRKGRPWEFAAIIGGFPTSKQALQFEWHWQHPAKSKLIRQELGDVQASKLGRQRGKMKTLALLLLKCQPFCTLPLVLYFFLHNQDVGEFTFKQAVTTLLSVEKKGSAMHVSDSLEKTLPNGMEIRLITNLQDMPFWKEKLREKASKTRADQQFSSNIFNNSSSKCRWDYFFKALCSYEERHGSITDVNPSEYSDLIDWMQLQRFLYHCRHGSSTIEGDDDHLDRSLISDEQIDALESIGFDWGDKKVYLNVDGDEGLVGQADFPIFLNLTYCFFFSNFWRHLTLLSFCVFNFIKQGLAGQKT